MNLLDHIGCQYIELSPSGNGLRGFGYGQPIQGTRGELDGLKVELYANKRYLTVTGRPLLPGPLVRLPRFADVAQAIRPPDLQKRTEEDGSKPHWQEYAHESRAQKSLENGVYILGGERSHLQKNILGTQWHPIL